MYRTKILRPNQIYKLYREGKLGGLSLDLSILDWLHYIHNKIRYFLRTVENTPFKDVAYASKILALEYCIEYYTGLIKLRKIVYERFPFMREDWDTLINNAQTLLRKIVEDLSKGGIPVIGNCRMSEKIFNSYDGKFVSVLIRGFRGNESYSGILRNIDEDVIEIEVKYKSKIKRIALLKSSVISIWEYNDNL